MRTRFQVMAMAMFAALAIAAAGHATISRVLFLDQDSMLVPDDNDIFTFPHLVPTYSNTFYVNVSPTVFAAGTIDLHKLGTLGLATNNPYTFSELYKNLSGGANLRNFKIMDIPTLPNSGAIKAADAADCGNYMVIPDDKLTLIYGRSMRRLSLGVAVEWAAHNRAAGWAPTDNNGNPAYNLPVVASTSIWAPPMAGMNVVALDNTQDSMGLRISPSIGLNFKKISIDVAVFTALNKLSNNHNEVVADGPGGNPNKVTINENWSDNGAVSYGLNSRGTMSLSEDSRMVALAAYSNQDLSMTHKVKLSSSGPVLGSTDDSFTDMEENYTASSWNLTAGWVSNLNPRTLFVAGISLKNTDTRYEDNDYTKKFAATKNSDNYLSAKTITQVNDFGMPFLAGIEYEPTPWAKLRATMGRNLWGSTSMDCTRTDYDESGYTVGQRPVKSSNDVNVAWTAGLGTTATWGQFGVDLGFSMDTPKLEDSAPSISGKANLDLTFKF